MVSVPMQREQHKCALYTGSLTATITADSDGGSVTTSGEPWDVGQFSALVWGVNGTVTGAAGASTYTGSLDFVMAPALDSGGLVTPALNANFWTNAVVSFTDAGGTGSASAFSASVGSQVYRGHYAIPLMTASADCAGAISATVTASVNYSAFYRH
jgi:hypothetical protein